MSGLPRDRLIGANFAFQHVPFERFTEAMRNFGMTEIELWGIAPHLDLHHAGPARVAEVRRILADDGLSVFCYTPEQVLYPINIASGDDAFRRDSIDRFRRAADICAELGAGHLFLTSGRGWECEPPETAWRRSADALREIAEHAAGLGVRCMLEPLQRVETNVVTDADRLARMLDEIAVDTVDVVLDTVAMATAGDDVAGYLRRFGDRIAHLQIVDGRPAGHLVWGDGTLPLGRWIEELVAGGYAGRATFEPFGDGSYALDPIGTWKRCFAAIEPHLERKTPE